MNFKVEGHVGLNITLPSNSKGAFRKISKMTNTSTYGAISIAAGVLGLVLLRAKPRLFARKLTRRHASTGTSLILCNFSKRVSY